jgi:hypothetical protein
MGGTYKVKCKCGYETDVAVGAGRALSFEHKSYYPVLCQACEKIDSSIFGPTEPICSHCQSTNILRYDHPDLRKVMEGELIENTQTTPEPKRHLELTEGLYYCPVCKDFGLKFEDTGLIWC